MTQYTKSGVIHTIGTPMQHPGREGFTINPNKEWLIANGWAKVIPEEPEPLPEPTPAEQRKKTYAIEQIIEWEGEILTVDDANALFTAYLAEGDNTKASQLSILILSVKQEIRKKYGDN